MSFPKPKTQISYKETIRIPKNVRCPLCYTVPSQITDQEREVSITPQEDGSSLVCWSYDSTDYAEKYTFHVFLDIGAVPKPDGTGMIVNGFPITLKFYKRVNSKR